MVMLSLTIFEFLVQTESFRPIRPAGPAPLPMCVRNLPFVIYLGIWIIYFVCANSILRASSGDPYDNLGVGISDYLNMFRSAIGDIKDPVF